MSSTQPVSPSPSKKRILSELVDDDSSTDLPPFKRRCATFQSDVIKSHAKFAKALGNLSPPGSNTTEDLRCEEDVAKHWEKKTSQERKNVLGQAHVHAERFLREKGVWDGVAQILDRHFTMSLLPAPEEPVMMHPTSSPSNSMEQEIESLVRSVVTEVANEQDVVICHPDEPVISADIVTSCVAETAQALVKTVSLATVATATSATTETTQCLAEALLTVDDPAPVMPISLVPNPLSMLVPNPLANIEPKMETPSCTPVKSSACSVSVDDDVRPVSVISLCGGNDDSPMAVSLSPLSSCCEESSCADSSRASPTSVPVWCLDEAALFGGQKNEINAQDWEVVVDPLVLLA